MLELPNAPLYIIFWETTQLNVSCSILNKSSCARIDKALSHKMTFNTQS